ncbi:MAG: RsmE family RNA methyltransferase [Opitutales bacterium]
MPDFRAYAPAVSAEAREILLGADESHHLVAVNRCGRGDPVIAFDGRGREWITECADPSRSGAVLTVKSTRQAAPLPCALTLAQALPKGAVMDEIVRQATEIGAARIVPLLSERTQVHLEADRAEKKIEKWRTTAIEAAKQCGNPWLPEISPLQKLDQFLAGWSPISTTAKGAGGDADAHPQTREDHDLRLVASLHHGAVSLKVILAQYRAKHGRAPQKVLWLVGPEGDFSPAEMTAAVMAGFAPVTLGPLVLRCDTAAIAALSMLSCELGN